MNTTKAIKSDAKEILELQILAYQSEAKLYNDYNIPPLTQSLEELVSQFNDNVFLKIVQDNTLIASVRAYQENATCYIGRVIVHPDYQNKGIGKILMKGIEKEFDTCKRYELFTGTKSIKNIHFYQKLGYKIFKTERLTEDIEFVYFEKKNNKGTEQIATG